MIGWLCFSGLAGSKISIEYDFNFECVPITYYDAFNLTVNG